jgi:serine/threonine-protein kinase
LEKIGKYEIIEKLGQGGMGVVYKARDPIIQRIVAIKTISAQLDSNPELRTRFFREARSAGQLSHVNIITIYDLGEENGRAYIAMEYLDGEDLKAKIAKREPLSLEAKLRIMIEVCDALAHAHERQVIHRDIKPGNIYITSTGQVKILDFGLAHVESSDITKSGQTLGTPNYMSPEQVQGTRATCQSDIFSTGTVFYELLTYHKPFEGDSYASILHKILNEEPMPMQRIDSRIPHELSDVVRKALAKNPEKRYQNAGEMVRALRTVFQLLTGEPGAAEGRPSERDPAGQAHFSGSEETVARTFPSLSIDSQAIPVMPATPKASKRLGYLAAAAVVAVVVGGALVLVFLRNRAETQTQPAIPAVAQAPAADKQTPGAETAGAAGLAEASGFLEKRKYAEAAERAQAILDRSPDNSEARRILAAARDALDKIAKGNQQPKPAVSAGNQGKEGAGKAPPAAVTPAVDTSTKAATVTQPPAPAEPDSGPPAAAQPPQNQQASRQAVLNLLQRFRSAYENKELSTLKTLWPSLTGAQEKAIQEEFQSAQSITIGLQGIQILFAENQALVSCRRDFQAVTTDGRKLQSESRATFSLKNNGTDWYIDAVRFDPPR